MYCNEGMDKLGTELDRVVYTSSSRKHFEALSHGHQGQHVYIPKNLFNNNGQATRSWPRT